MGQTSRSCSSDASRRFLEQRQSPEVLNDVATWCERQSPIGLNDPTDYLADLARARVAAVNGQDPEQALAELSKAWSERTKTLGPGRQTWHHRRSLTGLITAPEPPVK